MRVFSAYLISMPSESPESFVIVWLDSFTVF